MIQQNEERDGVCESCHREAEELSNIGECSMCTGARQLVEDDEVTHADQEGCLICGAGIPDNALLCGSHVGIDFTPMHVYEIDNVEERNVEYKESDRRYHGSHVD